MRFSKKYKWHTVAKTLAEIRFAANGMAEVMVQDKKFCIVLQGNNLTACSQKCPHGGGIMADGYIDGQGNIVCPLHRYKFNLQNGRNVSGEGYYLKILPVEQREDGIYVAIENTSFF